MPAYLFEIAPFLAGRSVTVRDAVSGSDVASGTLDANAKFTASLPVGDYVASASDGRYTYRASGVVDQGDPDRLTDSALSSTYEPALPDLTVTRDASGRVVSTAENGITTTYTRGPDGKVRTITRNGVTKTVTRSANGRLKGVA